MIFQILRLADHCNLNACKFYCKVSPKCMQVSLLQGTTQYSNMSQTQAPDTGCYFHFITSLHNMAHISVATVTDP